MSIKLAYGRKGLEIDLRAVDITVIEPEYVSGLKDAESAIMKALEIPMNSKPLKELISAEDTVAIVFSDLTRPVPNKTILPVVLKALSHVPKDHIVLINALGMHSRNSVTQLREMLGEEILREYRIVQHEANDKSCLAFLGEDSFGHDVWINKEYVQSTKRILTGFIEPHFFAGFSGGPKSVLPGISGGDLVMANHGAEMIGHPRATWGVTEGNPVHDEIREVAGMTNPDFLVNVALNKDKQITGIFAGEIWTAHRAGIDFVRSTAMKKVDRRFDIVITTNSGYPLDLNLYQAVKGMTAALQIVKDGGAIIAASECSQGVPEHGNFKSILAMSSSPQHLNDIIMAPGFLMFDQWEAQLLARILMRAKVYLKSDGLSEDDVRKAHIVPITSIEETVKDLMDRYYGPDASICILPEGPQTVPYLA